MFNNIFCKIKIIKYLLFLGSSLLLCFFDVDQVHAYKNILVIHSYNDDFPWTQGIKEGINEEISENTIDDIKVFHEYLDAKAHPKLHHSQRFLDYIEQKYHHTNLDVLMVSDDPGLSVVIKNRDKYFANIPIVYLGINYIEPQILELPNATGVFENRDVVEVIIEASKQMKSDRVIIINDTTETGKANLAKINECYQLFSCPSDIVILDDLTTNSIENRFAKDIKNTADTPVLLIGQIRKDSVNGNGELYGFSKSLEILQSKIENPIYGSNLRLLNKGAIGGKFLEPQSHAKQATKIAIKIIEEVPIDNIKPVLKAENKWIFNGRKLKEYNISIESLPRNSKIFNQDLSFYQKYKTLVWLTASAFGVSLVIILLLIEVIRRESINKRILSENEARYKDLAHAGANIFWEIDIKLKH